MNHKQLSEQELKKRIQYAESEYVERCSSPSDKKKIAKAICAFSNDIANTGQVGTMFIGLEDNGQCTGLSVTDEMLRNIASIRSDGNLQPFPVMGVRKWVFEQCEVIVLEVEPSKNPPLKYEGRCWIRIGPSVRMATEEEENRLMERRKAYNLPADMIEISGAEIQADLNMEYFKSQYLPSAVSREVLTKNNRNIEKQMQSLRLVNHKFIPTMTAILIIGNNPRNWFPGAYIQFVRFAGKTLTDPVKDQKEVSGTLPEQITRIEDILKAHISKSLKLSEKQHIESPDYPITALSQLVRNAIIHRDYKSNTPVRVHWFNDRIEIQSPGGPYGALNVDNFGGEEGITAYRNPTIAEAFKNLGFVERFGFGIPQARKALKENNNPELKFKVQESIVLAVVKPAGGA